MITISLLHPFTPKSIGLSMNDVLHSHSMPHFLALKQVKSDSVNVYIDYFSSKLFFKTCSVEGIEKRFWPISNSIIKKRNVWKKQYSNSHFRHNKSNSPDLTIINTSGHGTQYVFKLAQLLYHNKKTYIAMIGGMNVSYEGNASEYYKNANHIIVHTNLQKQQILKNESFKDFDIRVIPLGVDTNKFKPLKNENNYVEGNLLYVGRISRLKQIELAISSLKLLKENGFHNANLKIVGPISDKLYYKELKVLVENYKLVDSVIFNGPIPQQELLNFYQNADLLLLPSSTESFGMVMIEAMSCRTPVVAIEKSGGPDEIIQSGFNGLLTTNEEYSKSILKLLQNQHQYNTLKENVRVSVIEKYSIEITTKLLKESIKYATNSNL